MILRELTPTLHIPWSVPFQLDDPPVSRTPRNHLKKTLTVNITIPFLHV